MSTTTLEIQTCNLLRHLLSVDSGYEELLTFDCEIADQTMLKGVFLPAEVALVLVCSLLLLVMQRKK